MAFSDKLNALMKALDVSGSTLARAINIDRSSVSRFRSGMRGMPKLDTVRAIAEYFAASCGKSYQLISIAGIAGFPPFHGKPTDVMLADMLYNWMIDDDPAPIGAVGHFLQSMSAYDRELGENEGRSTGEAPPLGESSISIYRGNAGKRQAVLDFMAYIMDMGKPCRIKLFTDEDLGWITEDDEFSKLIAKLLKIQADMGCKFQRIQPLAAELDYSLRIVELWLSVYMTGAIRQYYYPYARDRLHRRTIFVVPGEIALFSSSIAGQRENMETVLTTSEGVVSNHNKTFDMIMNLCRPAMTVYSEEDPAELFDCLIGVSSIDAHGIYKSSSLSVSAMPNEIATRIAKSSSPAAQRMVLSLKKRIKFRDEVLKHNIITDIMCLEDVDEVMAGRAEILSTGILPDGPYYYTPDEYAKHIERILSYLENYPNYRAVLTTEPMWKDIIVYSKEGSRSCLIKASKPTTVFEITEQTMSDAIWDCLKRIADERTRTGERQKTEQRLRDELSVIRNMINGGK